MLNITDLKVEEKITPLLRLGFRPFFLLGSGYAALSVAIWVYAFQNGQPDMLGVPALWWHVHEMLFGFAMAIVAGFTLTAVQNWTGVNGTKSRRLAWLVGLWLAPRILFWTPAPLWLISSIEAVFLAMLAYEIGWRVYKVKGWRNLFFVPLFILALIANFASYATIKGMPPFTSMAVWQAMLWWFVLLLSVMGNRVIPFFTARRFNFEKPQPLFWLDFVATMPLVLMFVLSFFPLVQAELQQPILLFAGIFQLARFVRWKSWKTLSEPLVWSLHLSYQCLPVALILKGFAGSSYFSHTLWHLIAIGGLGGLILAMISRVTLGHTGRDIYKGPNMAIPFALVLVAAIVRSIAVSYFPQYTMQLIDLTAGLWIVAFAWYVVKFGPMLAKPRTDNRPG
ncbi:NnrS family protein [Vibrio sp. SCSIO 43136]|uniref:NnrS family protein n=1 Tax=Vibrio sp. SCSIO 43136 TaxID=2819101 RepID=UPI002074E26D|nr:NnrS family protein [Vibrio sp. SCSIO 43136]USD67103.1 NnrS family protein [Vibrio sp. SCSIO 43136]